MMRLRHLIKRKNKHIRKAFVLKNTWIENKNRKRLTQVFPFLRPLRTWQRKRLFYLKMLFDGNRYATEKSQIRLPNKVFEASSFMLSENSGFDIKYQINKIHNLKLAAKSINKIVIALNDTFSFWQVARWADRHEKYKEGLNLVDGNIIVSYGGGLCQLSTMLFWLFLHTPMTVIEQHEHSVASFLSKAEDLPYGIDAAIYEGWLDLKVRNDTDNTFQVEIRFDENIMHGCILSQVPMDVDYSDTMI